MATDPSRFERAIARFDAANALDPNRESVAGIDRPKELVYAERMTAMQTGSRPMRPRSCGLPCVASTSSAGRSRDPTIRWTGSDICNGASA